MIGETVGDWTVLSPPSDGTASKGKWTCRCKCGTTKLVAGCNLLGGGSKSCGCSSKRDLSKRLREQRRRRSAKRSWKKLLRAVELGTATMDPHWQTFENFFSDLGERHNDHLLSRRDLNGEYNATNCFWELRVDQMRRLGERTRFQLEPLLIQDGSTKRCTRCRLEKALNEFPPNDRLKDRKQPHCRECVKSSIQRASLADPSKGMIVRARTRARKKGFEFALTAEQLKPLPTHCPVFGIELTRGNGQQDPSAYSLDRIDNKKGYVPGNVIVMSYLANRLKNDGTAEQHARIADWMHAQDRPLYETAGISMGLL